MSSEQQFERHHFEPKIGLDQLCLKLHEAVGETEQRNLGPITERHDIASTLVPFQTLPHADIQYPEALKEALHDVLDEHDATLQATIQENLEWPDDDYQHIRTSDGQYFNPFAQIDIRGLPESFLQFIDEHDVDSWTLTELLKRNAFEVEVSLAMVNLLNGTNSVFDRGLRSSLDRMRQTHNKPIALLAPTQAKFDSMRAFEFGKRPGQPLNDEEVQSITGFDALLGPNEFMDIVRRHNGDSPFMLYVRPSASVDVLRDPRFSPPPSLLDDADIRRIIKRNAITPNIDSPTMPLHARLNDTKINQPAMGLSFPAQSADVLHDPAFITFLLESGIHMTDIQTGAVGIRAKPMIGYFGAWGHLSSPLGKQRLANQLAKNIAQRGPYVLQPELRNPTIMNTIDGVSFKYIHRMFLANRNIGGLHLGGVCNMIPTDSQEIKGDVERIHGNNQAVFRQIV